MRRKRLPFKRKPGLKLSIRLLILLWCFTLVFSMHTSWKPDTDACVAPSSPGSPKSTRHPLLPHVESPRAQEYSNRPYPPSPESSSSVASDDHTFDQTVTPPHDLDNAATKKWNRLCYQRQMLFDEVKRLEQNDLESHCLFPFARYTFGKSTKMPHLSIVNSPLLPGLLGIMPQYKESSVVKRNTKLCNYSGVIMTESEYEAFTENYGVYTGVACSTLNSLLPENSPWLRTRFFVRTSSWHQFNSLIHHLCFVCVSSVRSLETQLVLVLSSTVCMVLIKNRTPFCVR
jgi:hypothetical protein